MPERFICGQHKEIIYGLLPKDPVDLAKDSEKLCTEEGWSWIRMPLYPLAEARMLGANIRESEAGAWSSDSVEDLPEPVFCGPEAEYFLSAIRSAAALGKPVVLDLKGPLGVMDGLRPTTEVYRSLRRDDPYLYALTDGLVDWACRCIAVGARIVSLADNLATTDIIGKKNFCSHFWPLLERMIHGILSPAKPPVLFLCGKLSQDLVDTGLARVEKLPLSEPVSLDQALPCFPGMTLGLGCVHNPLPKRDFLYHMIFQQ